MDKKIQTNESPNKEVVIAFLQTHITIPAMGVNTETKLSSETTKGATIELTDNGSLIVRKEGKVAFIPSSNVKVALLK